MAHLQKFRKGWQGEHLARYILSKFSFVSQPVCIADDLGTDFICTRFEMINDNLFPLSSFAIQIKCSKNKKIPANKYMQYLEFLELPYFIGIMDLDNLRIQIFSGEAIPHFYTKFGNPLRKDSNSKIFIKLFFNEKECPKPYSYSSRSNSYFINFPFLLELTADLTFEDIQHKIGPFIQNCNIMQFNNSSRKSREYIYNKFKDKGFAVFAGPDSKDVFRENFFKRLAEVFANLHWISYHFPSEFKLKEFSLYDDFYQKIIEYYKKLPECLTERYEGIKDFIKNALPSKKFMWKK